MHSTLPQTLLRCRGACAAVVVIALLLSACKDGSLDPKTASALEVSAVVATPAPASASAASPSPSTVSPQPTPAFPVADAAPKKVPLSIQGVAPAGVTVRVKGVEIGGDATVLDVSISFANRITNSTMLALVDTYLQDESGARLHIKRPDNNREMTIREGETLNGQLVFMGAVAPSARMLKLVFNEGNEGDNIVAPGLVIDLPLQGV